MTLIGIDLKVSKQHWMLALSVLLMLVLVHMQFRNWREAHLLNMDYLIDAADGVLQGRPHWRAFQGRVMSPAVVHVLGWISPQPMLVFVYASLAALNVALFLMVWQRLRNHLLAMLIVMGSALLWVLEQHASSYTWDFTEAGCWLALSWFALNRGTLGAILGLILFSAFNRESALFMGLYPLVCGAWLWREGRMQGRRWVQASVAVCLLVLVVTEVLRKALFDYSSLSGVGGDMTHAVFENHFNVTYNLRLLHGMVRQTSPLLFIIAVYAMALLYIIQVGWRRRAPQLLGLGVALLAYFMSLVVFGVVDELRLYQPLNWCVPYLLLANHGAIGMQMGATQETDT